MISLREILHECDQSLWSALDGSWTVAKKEWLSALKMESESHGGQPHIESVEDWINRIAEACRQIWSPHGKIPFCFNPVEIYITLCGVLFHDIGRGRPCGDHGKISREIVERHWAQLGIRDRRIAHEIGLICQFHTSEEKWNHHAVTTIHPWGVVHTEAIASLLTLADELDTAYTRSAPEYLKDPRLLLKSDGIVSLQDLLAMEEDYFTKGLFREFIGDVNLDPESNLIKTVLFNDRLPGLNPIRDYKDSSKSAALSWLNQVCKKGALTADKFSPEDHFFSYLQEMRSQINSNIHNLLAYQFQKAVNYNRVKLINELKIPGDYPLTKNLIYNLHLWDRQITTGPMHLARKEKEDIKDLQSTINLIENTIEEVKRKIDNSFYIVHEKDFEKSAPQKDNTEKTWSLRWLLKFLYHYLVYLDDRKKTLKDEQRVGKEKFENDLREQYKEWKKNLDIETFNGLKSKNNNQKDKIKNEIGILKEMIDSLNQKNISNPHSILLQIFQYLLHFDLFQLADNINKNTKILNESVVRPKESWTVEEFHRNVLLGFHVYLANVRYLWKNVEEIDFRYTAMGKIESAFTHSKEDKNNKSKLIRTLIKHLSPIFEKRDASQESEKSQDGCGSNLDNKKDSEIEPLEKSNPEKDLINYLQEFSERSKERNARQTLSARDFEFAIRFMFMQWLSGDIRKKKKQLARILPGLEKLEIPFREWFIEYNNHLFDEKWDLRLEPSLKVKRIIESLIAIDHLNEGLHTDNPLIPWATLAAQLRDPNIERVKAAAKRLANLIRVFNNIEPPLNHHHFGHLLLAELSTDRKQSETLVFLETSHSGWRLKINMEQKKKSYQKNDADQKKDFIQENKLKGIIEHLQKMDDQYEQQNNGEE